MSHALPRFTDTRLDDERKLARILRDSGDETRPALNLALAEAGDLRGIPCIARGVGGMSTESRALLNRVERQDW